MIKNKRKTRRELSFIATRFRNEPIDITFYTKEGIKVPPQSVKKKTTPQGVKFYATLWVSMGKKKPAITSIDFETGIGEIIPSTQQAYLKDSVSGEIQKKEKQSLLQFQAKLGEKIASNLKDNEFFPTEKEVFVFIFQYFVGEKDYLTRDIDNMAKTILDTLKGVIYKDDGQVKTLLVGKKIEKRVPKNFAYIAIKLLTKDQDVDALKISGIERSITLFNALKKQGIL